MSIPATKKQHSLPHKSGATVLVRQLGRFELGRLQAFTRFRDEDPESQSLFMIYASKACIVGLVGHPDLAGVRPAQHAQLDMKLMPDEVAEFALEDEAVQQEIVALLAASTLGRDYIPNSLRQPAGSTESSSGLPPTVNTPKT